MTAEETISRERLTEAPGEVYTSTILEPSFRFMMREYFGSLLEANKAWAVMLGDTGIITDDNTRALLRALNQMIDEGAEAFAEFNPHYEYFYSHLEHRLAELAGPAAAGEINLGRTRPEPLSRMALRPRILQIAEELGALIGLLLEIAERERDTIMPQWTHMQPAQPTTMGHYLMGVVGALLRDAHRVQRAYGTANACTLGCGALAGTSYPVDRDVVANLLGFDEVRENTIDCVASGDYALETSAAVANLAITLSRLCQDMYTWCTDEFRLVEIGDSFSGSSSMMPQKKNAYPFEYVRARAARAVGEMGSTFGSLHNTNFGDIKDVEEEMVPPVFRACDEMVVSLQLLRGTLETLNVNKVQCGLRAGAGFSTATELAAMIHRKTEHDYRAAHRVVGHLVLLATQRGIDPDGVDLKLVDKAAQDTLGSPSGLTERQVREAMDPHSFVALHTVKGGPAPAPMAEALEGAHAGVREHSKWVSDKRRTLADARDRLAALVDKRIGR